MEIEIGRGKKGRRAYGLDEIAIVPSRRTRDPEDVDLTWRLDGPPWNQTREAHKADQRGRIGSPAWHCDLFR